MDAAVHGTLLVADVAGFGDPRRNNRHQLAVRAGLYSVLTQAFTRADLPWGECHNEDRGDGIMVIAPATVPKAAFATSLPQHLLSLLHEHNATHPAEERIRLRISLHAGELHRDDHGVTGRSVNHAFRLVEAPAFKEAAAGALLAVITSTWFYEEVVWHSDATGYRQIPVNVKETSTKAWIWLSDSDSQEPTPPTSAPRQLPTNVRQFVGRSKELDRLTDLLGRSTADTIIITAIDGSAGIGKTALALHWAHRVKDRFPDGQLHVNLRGFDPREPMEAGLALHNFLQTLGADPKSIPTDVDGKAALYRSMLAGRRMLIVLDNARSAEHVRPLLPGTSSCVTIITSRNRLDGLTVHEGAHRISLDVLSRRDALALLAERVPGPLDPQAATELIDLCARLPLALSVVAARAAEQPALSLVGLVGELRAERNRLDALDLGEVDLSVRAVFSWSYQVLSPPAARLFRLLGVHPGPDIDPNACDALLGQPARKWLTELTRAHLLTEYVPGRYRFHDLLRVYATELAATDEERTPAFERTLDHYLNEAEHADCIIHPYRDGIMRTEPPGSYAQAMAWFAAEDTALLSLITLAADNGYPEQAWQLTRACIVYLRRNGRFHDRVKTHRTVAKATHGTADHAIVLCHLATAIARIGQVDEALSLLHEASLIGGPDGETQFLVHITYAKILKLAERITDACEQAETALELAEANGRPLHVADARNILGKQLRLLERHEEALLSSEMALTTYREARHRDGQADILVTIGLTKQALGHREDALRCFEASLAIDHELSDLHWEGMVLSHIGNLHAEVGHLALARKNLQQALRIFERIRHPEARILRNRLSTLDAHAE